MIMLLDDTYQVIKMVNTDDQLFLYLKESIRTLDEQTKQNWRFAQYSHKLLCPILKEIQGESFLDMAHKACQQENDLIVMSTGDGGNPSLFLETFDLDVDALRNEWCRLFCKANNMHIVTQ
jgi:hypothetical protein